MNDRSNNQHIRNNYRSTIEGIRKILDAQCEAFDKEMGAYNMKEKKNG
jgi:hypothetical protein